MSVRSGSPGEPTGPVWRLQDMFLGDEGCVTVCDRVLSNPTVTELDLKGNGIHGAGARAIANLIAHNPRIETLRLEWNRLGMMDEGVQHIANAIENTASLTRVGVCCWGVSDALPVGSAEQLCWADWCDDFGPGHREQHVLDGFGCGAGRSTSSDSGRSVVELHLGAGRPCNRRRSCQE